MKKIIGLGLTVILVLGLTVSAGAVYQDEIRVYTPEKPFAQYQEAPELKIKVASGELPPVAERLPDIPPVVVPREEIGKYGGMMRTYQRSEKIFNWVTNIVREGLLRYDSQRSYIYPNLAKDYKVSQDETEVTVYLHKGVKWSDGHLLTVDDFIFAFDSYLAYHPDKENLKPAQYIQPKYLVGEEPLEFEKIDDYTMILRSPQAVLGWWEKVLLDNAYSPPLLPFPAHVMKKLHPMYNPDPEMSIDEQWQKFSDMVGPAWHNHLPLYADIPSIGPWISEKYEPGVRLVVKRNPYYWKVDPEGNQLPYIDGMESDWFAEEEVGKLRVLAGEVDYMYWGGPSTDIEVWAGQERGGYRMVPISPTHDDAFRVHLPWLAVAGPEDQNLVELLTTPKFLEALDHAIDKTYLGDRFLVKGGMNKPYWHPAWKGPMADNPKGQRVFEEYIEPYWGPDAYDLDKANQMLDELGLEKGSDGLRRYKDGSSVELRVGLFAGAATLEEAPLMMFEEWKDKLGITVHTKSTQYEGLAVWMAEHELPLLAYPHQERDWIGPLEEGITLKGYVDDEAHYLWWKTEGEQGVEPHPKIKEDLLQIYELKKEQGLTSDPERRTELAIEAAEILLRNHWMIVFMNELGAAIINKNLRNVAPEVVLPWTSQGFEHWFYAG